MEAAVGKVAWKSLGKTLKVVIACPKASTTEDALKNVAKKCLSIHTSSTLGECVEWSKWLVEQAAKTPYYPPIKIDLIWSSSFFGFFITKDVVGVGSLWHPFNLGENINFVIIWISHQLSFLHVLQFSHEWMLYISNHFTWLIIDQWLTINYSNESLSCFDISSVIQVYIWIWNQRMCHLCMSTMPVLLWHLNCHSHLSHWWEDMLHKFCHL